MTIQIAGKSGLRDQWVTINLSFEGSKFLTKADVVKLRPALEKAGFDASQSPVIRKTKVKTEKLKKDIFFPLDRFSEDSSRKNLLSQKALDRLLDLGEISPSYFEGDCIANPKKVAAAGVKLPKDSVNCEGSSCTLFKQTDPVAINCAGKISVLFWNIRRKDGTKIGDADTGKIRLALREGGIGRVPGIGPIGLQPGVTEFGEIPIETPVGFGLTGLAMVVAATLMGK